MKSFFIKGGLFFWCLILLTPQVLADKASRYNKLRQKPAHDRMMAEIDAIPIYREKLTGDYQILGHIKGTDALSRDKKSVMRQMRTRAYEMKADAIMEYRCSSGTKSIYQSCEGFGIRYNSR